MKKAKYKNVLHMPGSNPGPYVATAQKGNSFRVQKGQKTHQLTPFAGGSWLQKPFWVYFVLDQFDLSLLLWPPLGLTL